MPKEPKKAALGDVDSLLTMVTPEYQQAIVHVISQWSLMEIILNTCIWQAAGLRNDYGWVVCAQLQVPSKLATLETLLNQRRPILGQQFKMVAQYVRDYLRGERNIVAHGTWATNPLKREKYFVVKFSARGHLVSQGRIIPIHELNQLAQEIASVTNWLSALAGILPKLRQRPGGLGHKSRGTQSLQDYATHRQLLQQPPTLSRKEWEKRLLVAQPPKKGKEQQTQHPKSGR
jgi:hypothetical protein